MRLVAGMRALRSSAWDVSVLSGGVKYDNHAPGLEFLRYTTIVSGFEAVPSV